MPDMFVNQSWQQVKAYIPVSYTHLDVYKRQIMNIRYPIYEGVYRILTFFLGSSQDSIDKFVKVIKTNYNTLNRCV